MKSKLLAAILALLTVTAPAHAALVTIVEDVNVSFGTGFQEIGTMDFLYGWVLPFPPPNPLPPPVAIGWCCGNPTLYFVGVPVPNGPVEPGAMNIIGNDIIRLFGDLSSPNFFDENLVINTANMPNQPLTFSDFTLNGVTAISGDVTCISGCDLSSVPLPAALPLFASAMAGFGGLGWFRRKSGKVSS